MTDSRGPTNRRNRTVSNDGRDRIHPAGKPGTLQLAKQLPMLRDALQGGSPAASLAREILRGMIEAIQVQPTPGRESHINCPWDITVTGPIEAVLEMPDVAELADNLPLRANSAFARRAPLVLLERIELSTSPLPRARLSVCRSKLRHCMAPGFGLKH